MSEINHASCSPVLGDLTNATGEAKLLSALKGLSVALYFRFVQMQMYHD
jgi:hypothetical protein